MDKWKEVEQEIDAAQLAVDGPLTIRDRFAMAAVSGLCADPSQDFSPVMVAKTAYTIANALMKRRQERP